MKCKNCTYELNAKWSYCPSCGTASLVKSEQQTEIEKIKELHYTFYEKIVMWGDISVYWVCLFIGVMLFVIHFFLEFEYGGVYRTNLSLYLSLVITFALATLIWATRQFRRFLLELFISMKIEIDEFNDKYIEKMNEHLGTAEVLKYGFFFGAINTSLGYAFGLKPMGHIPKISITVQLFLAGLVCGFAVCGIVAVIKFINRIDGEKIDLNMYSLDNCGGTSFIGQLVVKYSLITLFVGLLINLCINGIPWFNSGSHWTRNYGITQLLMNSWEIFPFVMSLFVVMFPVWTIHKTISSYKNEHTVSLKVNLKNITHNLEYNIKELSAEQLAQLKVQYELYKDRSSRIKDLSTWPYSLSEKSKYVSFFSFTLTTLTDFIPNIRTFLSNYA